MNGRACDECGKALITLRKGARFCGRDCKNAWHNKHRSAASPTDKRLQAVQRAEKQPRRRSRDGSGVRIYLSADEIAALREVIGSIAARVLGVPQLPSKLDRAAQRVERKECS